MLAGLSWSAALVSESLAGQVWSLFQAEAPVGLVLAEVLVGLVLAPAEQAWSSFLVVEQVALALAVEQQALRRELR